MHGPPEGAFGYGNELPLPGAPGGKPRTSGTALAALASGILSFVCLYGLGGVLAIALGWLAHGEIERAEGRLGGRGLANTGIGLGVVNLVACVVGIGVLVAYAIRPDPVAAATPVPALPPPTVIAPRPTPATPEAPPEPSGQAAPEAALPTLPARIGHVSVVDATASSTPLDSLLRDEFGKGKRAGQTLIVWTVAPGCEPCAAVGRAIADPLMQKALAGARLVRVDVTVAGRDLVELGVPIEKIPGFTLIDAETRPLDHIHGGEWDADIPANIAPVLDKFLHRALTRRRDPWSRPLRDGELPL